MGFFGKWRRQGETGRPERAGGTAATNGTGPAGAPRPAGPAALEARGLSVGYGGSAVVSDIDFAVAPGEIFAVIGGSGCGKSTLLRTLEGLIPPIAGAVRVAGAPFAEAGAEPDDEERSRRLRRVGALFQGGALFGSMTLLENVGLPLREFTDLPEELVEETARLRLAQVGLAAAAGKYPSEISGGMAKRAGLARALALDPAILLLDEPSAGLDPVTSAGLDSLVLRLRDECGTAVVLVSHELPSLLAVADRALYLSAAKGRPLETGRPREMRDASPHPEIRAFFRRQSAAATAAAATGDNAT